MGGWAEGRGAAGMEGGMEGVTVAIENGEHIETSVRINAIFKVRCTDFKRNIRS